MMQKKFSKIIYDSDERLHLMTILNILMNAIYSSFHILMGFQISSKWMITIGIYYIILCFSRILSMIFKYENKEQKYPFYRRVIGGMMFLLSLTFQISLYLAMLYDEVHAYETTIMISMASYTFYKIIMAIMNMKKAIQKKDFWHTLIRNISFADALASIMSLQMSMYHTFSQGNLEGIQAMNAGTGICICLSLYGLSISLILNKNRGKLERNYGMATSKIIQINKKIEQKVVGTFQKINDKVVSDYTKIEDGFVDRYLTQESESVDEAKKRLKEKKEQKKL